MMRTQRLTVLAPLGLLALTCLAPAIAYAKTKSSTVTACSRYGSDCYTAPVRQTSLGPKMQLKGGTWIWCETDCRDTLRRETVDFWQDQMERSR